MYRLRALAVVFLALLTSSLAQRFDQCELTIHVRATDERDLPNSVHIELISPAGTPIDARQTNAAGLAFFKVSSGITYTARISGDNVETTTTDFHIMGGKQSHTENLTVRRTTLPSAVGPNPPTVSVAQMTVPPKAKEQADKGLRAFDKGDLAKAQQYFQKAAEIYPRYALAYSNLGVIAAKSGDRTRARAMLSKAVETDENFLPAYLHLARLDIQEKQYSAAESQARKALLLNPDMPEAVSLLAAAEYENKEYDQALADAQHLHTIAGHEPFASSHLLAGQILETRNKYPEAVHEYELFLQEDPNNPRAPLVKQAIADLQAAKH